VDEKGRTIGEILQSDICDPLGGVDAFIGLSPAEMTRVAPVEYPPFGYLIKQSLIPAAFGRKLDWNIFELMSYMKFLHGIMKSATRQDHPPELLGSGFNSFGSFYNEEKTRAAEIPSGNGHSSARGMAALASMMANDGIFQGSRILSKSTMDSFHADPTEKDMIFNVNYFTKGGVGLVQPPTVVKPIPNKLLPKGDDGCYGWYGLGGSVFQWHPELKIGFGFAATFLHLLDLYNVRGKNLLAEAIKCAKKKQAS